MGHGREGIEERDAFDSGESHIDIAMVGGSEYPDQSLPDGKGPFVFESYDPDTDIFKPGAVIVSCGNREGRKTHCAISTARG